ncbi:hypothetical protein O4J55_00590, partial [Paracoccus sp. PXZ]
VCFSAFRDRRPEYFDAGGVREGENKSSYRPQNSSVLLSSRIRRGYLSPLMVGDFDTPQLRPAPRRSSFATVVIARR